MRSVTGLGLLFVLTFMAAAQERPPALLVPQDGRQRPMQLAEMAVKVRIHGFLAETETTMTFRNPTDQVLAGTLYFPLPDDATISGYALDIKGTMVEGVVVEKQKGRVVFEKIVRQGIDPGLVEWTQGNTFKTRIFPIPAKGTRRIRVRYTDKIDGNQYRLPLALKNKLDRLSLDIRVLRGKAKPHAVGGGLTKLEFLTWEQGFAAQTELKDVQPNKDLIVDLPPLPAGEVLVERAADGICYFAITDQPTAPATPPARTRPKHIAIYWDASGSRAGKHTKELELLEALLGPDGSAWPPNADGKTSIAVDLYVIRNTISEPQRFQLTPSSSAKLTQAISQLYYDGGTQLGAIVPTAEAPDYYLVFSDGLSTFGKAGPKGMQAPVYTISDDTSKNSYAMRELARRSSGQFLNLSRMSPAKAAQQVGVVPFSFRHATVTGAAAECYPSMPVAIQDSRFVFAGAFTGDQTKLQLSYGIGKRETGTQEITVSRADAVEANLLRRYWAQRKLAELLINRQANETAITALGKEYGLVTPFTSLIVLDSLEQYVEHRIQPPASLPEMRKQYAAIMAKRKTEEEQVAAKNLEHIKQLWEARTNWWSKVFEYPKDYRYQSEKAKKEARPAAALRNAPAPEDEMALRDAPASAEESEDDAAEITMDTTPVYGGPAGGGPRVAVGHFGGSAARKSDEADSTTSPGIAVKKWDPKTPYLKALQGAQADDQLVIYLMQKKNHGSSPAFFLDCADFFMAQKKPALALQVLSNIAELELENAALLRVLGHRLAQLQKLDLAVIVLEQVLRLRPEEPQSLRDLAVVLNQRGEVRADQDPEAAHADFVRAADLLARVVTRKWDRFDEIELIALTELNTLFARHLDAAGVAFPVDPSLRRAIPHDLRIIMTWDADNTDIDLWVTEPSGEKVFYSHNRSHIGGRMSRDFTRGYGPEEYTLKKAMPGNYKIQANFYGSQSVELTGAVTIQVDIFTNYGRPNQEHQSITRRLQTKKEVVDLGIVEF